VALIEVPLLVIFGACKLSGMARGFGRFVSEARRYNVENHNSDPHEVLGELLVQPG
jgi:Sec-independent protein translocase protein TatA